MPCPCGSRLIWRYYHYFNGHSGLAAYVHRVICVPFAECTLCIPRHWWGEIKLCQSRVNKWKLIFPNEWLALNPLFTEILFLSGIFTILWKAYFKYMILYAIKKVKIWNAKSLEGFRTSSLKGNCNKHLSIWRVFLKYLKQLQYIMEL